MTHRDRSEYKIDSSVMAVCKSVTIPGMTGHVRRNTHKEHMQGNGYKNYPVQALERLLHIKALKELGFTLAEIVDLLDLIEKKENACGGLPEKLDAKIEVLDKKMVVLALYKERLVAVRQSCSGQCSSSNGLPECFSFPCC